MRISFSAKNMLPRILRVLCSTMSQSCLAVAAVVVCLALFIYYICRSGGGGGGGGGDGVGSGVPVLRSGASGVPCPNGQVCQGGICGPCNNPNAPCPDGLVCAGGACSMCSSNVPCPPGIQCIGGLCTRCSATVPCPPDQACNNGICGPCGIGAPCPAGKACLNGKCIPACPDTPCSPGQVCDGGICGPCSSDVPCPDGQICSGGACIPKCVPCDNDLHSCGAGQICMQGSCVAAPACGAASPCPAGLTCGADGRCAGCYVWKTWAAPFSTPPPDIYGVGTFPGIASAVAPVVDPSQGTGGYGFIDALGNFNGIEGGALHPSKPSQVLYLAAAKSCPPLAALTNQQQRKVMGPSGNPAICMDLAKKGPLTAYWSPCDTYAGYNFQMLGY